MIVSFFADWYSVGVDYSQRQDCIWIWHITQQDYIDISFWKKYFEKIINQDWSIVRELKNKESIETE